MSERRFSAEQIVDFLSTAFDSTFKSDRVLADSCVEIAPVLSLNRPDSTSVVGIYLTNGQKFKAIVEEIEELAEVPSLPTTPLRYLGDSP